MTTVALRAGVAFSLMSLSALPLHCCIIEIFSGYSWRCLLLVLGCLLLVLGCLLLVLGCLLLILRVRVSRGRNKWCSLLRLP
jgi:hypothetical protein